MSSSSSTSSRRTPTFVFLFTEYFGRSYKKNIRDKEICDFNLTFYLLFLTKCFISSNVFIILFQEIYPENPGFSPQSNIPLPFNTENSKPSGYNPYPEQNKYSTRPEPTSYNEISNSPVNNVEFSKPCQHQDDIYPVYNSYNDNRKIDIYPDIEANRLEKNSENNDIFMYNQFNSNDSPQNEYNQRHQKYNSQPHQEYDSDPHLEYNSGSHQDHFNKFKHNFIMNPDKW